MAFALVALLVGGAALLLPLKSWTGSAEQFFSARGAQGLLLFTAAYVVATVLMIPTWFLSLAAGALFGALVGFAVVVPAAFLGGLACYALSRRLLREAVRKRLTRYASMRAIDAALRERGWRAVALVRLTPVIPNNVQSYALGASAVPLRAFATGMLVGGLPSQAVYAFLGASGRSLHDGGPAEWLMLAAGLLATLALAVYGGRYAKRRLGL